MDERQWSFGGEPVAKFRLSLARSGLEGLCITSVGCIHVSTYKARESKVSPWGIPPGR